jgi:hypothetical protein
MDELLELSSKLQIEQKEIADKMIDIMRKDIDYMERIRELERRLAVMVNLNERGIFIKNNKGKLEW